jgi:hypothetical protein
MRRLSLAAAVAIACSLAAGPVFAASPAPKVASGPKAASGPKMHADYEVAVNHLGQVTRVAGGHQTKDVRFNQLTLGNVMQIAIRTEDGMHAIVGVYQVNYDFDPATHKVSRTIKLLKEGGVDPNARGAVFALQDMAKRSQEHAAALAAAKRRATPGPTAAPTRKPS